MTAWVPLDTVDVAIGEIALGSIEYPEYLDVVDSGTGVITAG